MTTLPQTVPAGKFARMVVPYDSIMGIGGMLIHTPRGDVYYVIRGVPSDFGDAFALQREDSGESYLVELADEGCRCNCADSRYRNPGACKHVKAMRALRDAGKL